MINGPEVGWNKDGGEGEPATEAEQLGGCSQHGELGRQSSEDVGVDDGVEGLRPKWQAASAGHNRARSGGGAVGGRSMLGAAHSRKREVSHNHLAAGLPGKIQARPTTSCADTEEPIGGGESEAVAELVRLIDGGVAVPAVVTAEHSAFDLGSCVRSDAVTLGEDLSGLDLISACHD
jgi:hypothetical protein